MAKDMYTGTLVIDESCSPRKYKAKFKRDGIAKEMPVCTDARCFREEEAVNGDPIEFELEGEKIGKVVIPGKTKCAPKICPSVSGKKPAQNYTGGFQQRPRYQKDGGYQQAGRYQQTGRYQQGGSGQHGGSGQQPVEIPDATAPYNFVCQNCILEAPRQTADEEYYSGTVVCSLKALTPLLVAGQQTNDPAGNEAKPKTFFTVNGQPVITGASLKGLVRSCVETLSCSSLSCMNDRHVFGRNFDDRHYRNIMKIGEGTNPQEAGYLVRRGADFEIVPVKYKRVPWNYQTEDPGKKLVTTGPMPGKKHNYLFDAYKRGVRGIPVPDEMIDDFFLQLTPAQENFLKEKYLKEKYQIDGATSIRRMGSKEFVPVFYLPDGKGGLVFFGLARYFRCMNEFKPVELRDKTMGTLPENAMDFAMALFGYAKKTGSQKGKVSFSAAVFNNAAEVRLREAVMGQPHHTCFAHYLVQDRSKMRPMKKKWNINSMTTYNSLGKIRGRKYYWHRFPLDIPSPPNANRNVQSRLVPLEAGCEAQFTMYLDRVTLVELGALLESLLLPEGHAHKIGMGKSFGLGSVRVSRISSDIVSEKKRYSDLEKRWRGFFGKNNAASAGGSDEPLFDRARNAFRTWLLAALKEKSFAYADYGHIPAVEQFMRMTDFEHRPDNEKTKNMELSEFRELRVLPEPGSVR